MQTVSELDLFHLPMEQPGFAADPLPWFEKAREQHPWLAKWKFGIVVTEYLAMRELFRRDDMLRPPYATSSMNWASAVRRGDASRRSR